MSQSVAPTDPVRLCFAESQKMVVEHFLNRIHMRIDTTSGDSEHYFYVVIDRNQAKVFLQRLYFAEVSLFNLEHWYSSVRSQERDGDRPLTSPSWFIPLNDFVLKLLQRLLSARLLGGDESSLSKTDISNLSNLERRIESAMKEGGKEYYFARLSTRSPKDGIPKTNTSETASTSEKLKLKHEGLKVSNAQQVIALLTRSQRVFGDITNFFQFRDSFRPADSLGQTAPALNLILREWIEDLEPAREFRCYVHRGNISAISQYYCYDSFEEYSSRCDENIDHIRAAIVAFHATVGSTFSSLIAPNYVFDVILSQDFSVQVVELNPFGSHMSSGAALFNWDTDRSLLYSTSPASPPPIRVLERLL
jgi:hypothetical protein